MSETDHIHEWMLFPEPGPLGGTITCVCYDHEDGPQYLDIEEVTRRVNAMEGLESEK